jgi:hypothetical protein
MERARKARNGRDLLLRGTRSTQSTLDVLDD